MKREFDDSDDEVPDHLTPNELGQVDQPLEPWLAELTHEALPELDVPREAMWAAIQRERAARTNGVLVFAAPVRVERQRRWPTLAVLTGLAATLVAGIAIGRYAKPASVTASDSPPVATAAAESARSDSTTNDAQSADPLRIALSEHLARTEALLTSVRYDDPDAMPAPDVASWARELLETTRLLLDDPALRDARTRRLLEDLELVLVQVTQARGASAPQTRRAPSETLRDTNLLPRVRAATSASNLLDNYSSRGIAE